MPKFFQRWLMLCCYLTFLHYQALPATQWLVKLHAAAGQTDNAATVQTAVKAIADNAPRTAYNEVAQVKDEFNTAFDNITGLIDANPGNIALQDAYYQLLSTAQTTLSVAERNTDVNTFLRPRRARIANLTAPAIATLTAERNTARADLATRTIERDTARTERDNAQRDLTAAQTNNTGLLGQMATLGATVTNITNERNTHQQNLTQAHQQIADLQDQLDTVTTERDTRPTQQQLAAETAAKQQALDAKAATEQHAQQLQQQLATETAAKQQALDAKAAAEQQAQQLQQQLAAEQTAKQLAEQERNARPTQQAFDQLQQQLNTVTADRDARPTQQQLAAETTAKQMAEQRAATAEAAKVTAEQAKTQAEQRATAAEDERDAARATNTNLQGQIATVAASVTSVTANRDSNLQEINRLKDKNQQLKANLLTLNRQLKAKEEFNIYTSLTEIMKALKFLQFNSFDVQDAEALQEGLVNNINQAGMGDLIQQFAFLKNSPPQINLDNIIDFIIRLYRDNKNISPTFINAVIDRIKEKDQEIQQAEKYLQAVAAIKLNDIRTKWYSFLIKNDLVFLNNENLPDFKQWQMSQGETQRYIEQAVKTHASVKRQAFIELKEENVRLNAQLKELQKQQILKLLDNNINMIDEFCRAPTENMPAEAKNYLRKRQELYEKQREKYTQKISQKKQAAKKIQPAVHQEIRQMKGNPTSYLPQEKQS